VYRVRTLADSGPHSLRDAVSAGQRCVVFDVAGEIILHRQLYVAGSLLTVDGFTAPAPGITLRGYGIAIWGDKGAHDVILRGLRFRDAGQKSCAARGPCYDGIQVKRSYRIVIDHVSVDHAADGTIDVGGDVGYAARDITIQWSIMSGTRNQSLIGDHSVRVSQYRNLFIAGQNRNSQAQWDGSLATQPPATVLDFRNNVVWGFSDYGTIIRRNATANVVANYYYQAPRHAATAGRALVVDRQGRAHATANNSQNGVRVDAQGTEAVAFPAPPAETTDACTAAHAVIHGAGARGPAFALDGIDRAYIGELVGSSGLQCRPPSPPSPASHDSALR
jgi:hypothetical protein